MDLMEKIKERVAFEVFDTKERSYVKFLERNKKEIMENEKSELLGLINNKEDNDKHEICMDNNINIYNSHNNQSDASSHNEAITKKKHRKLSKQEKPKPTLKLITNLSSNTGEASRKNSIENKEFTQEEIFLNEVAKNIISDKNINKNLNYFYKKVYNKNNDLEEKYSAFRKKVCMRLFSLTKSAVSYFP